ncbi:MAG: hypothetical protein JO197_01470 [Acidobacteria bacterium]|nr:hypothetical protein [Acidobacteriota bacterium]MBV9476215.1 hypothetical protein [Acidobacteriota bacterium]
MIAYERRASAILFHLLRGLGDPRPFLLPANVCAVVIETFAAARQPYSLVDIEELSLAIDAHRCIELVRAEPGAYAGLLFVRPYGSERPPLALFDALRALRSDFVLIDDRCLARPDFDGTSLVPPADVSLFSSGYAKYADLGRGGFAFLRERLPYARDAHGPAWLDLAPPDDSWDEYRRRVSRAVDAAAAQKEALNAIYLRRLPAHVALDAEFQQWRFNLRVPAAERLVERLFDAGLFASRHYAPHGKFAVAARLHAEIVNLFNDRYFDVERATRASDVVLRHLDAIG